MKISLEIKDKPINIDSDLNEEEMDTTPFQYVLEELSQFVTGSLILSFNDGHKVILNLFFDFSVCYDDIIEYIISVDNGLMVKNEIWFCKQGSDFYFCMRQEVLVFYFCSRKVI
ncbi:hypothetical protein [Superficieibacter sp. 1612_C1]|uniref:hypothetical protein n=1 Tax=Superficieibacter sp. 1612_C1 TaxID=2780382 RepID=UPI00188395C8|nr:hypothetical protein [Superficieibacter sp. 1612_C1]